MNERSLESERMIWHVPFLGRHLSLTGDVLFVP